MLWKRVNFFGIGMLLLFLILWSAFLVPVHQGSAKVSRTVDSMTRAHIQLCGIRDQSKFQALLENRLESKLSQRLDTLDYDYAFIDELVDYSDSSFMRLERYFHQGDTSACFQIWKGILKEESIFYTINYSVLNGLEKEEAEFPKLLKKYSRFSKSQTLNYSKIQVWSHGCVVQRNGAKHYQSRRKRELKNTYRISTLVDKHTNTTNVSVQTAPRHPKFKVVSYNPIWDF